MVDSLCSSHKLLPTAYFRAFPGRRDDVYEHVDTETGSGASSPAARPRGPLAQFWIIPWNVPNKMQHGIVLIDIRCRHVPVLQPSMRGEPSLEGISKPFSLCCGALQVLWWLWRAPWPGSGRGLTGTCPRRSMRSPSPAPTQSGRYVPLGAAPCML